MKRTIAKSTAIALILSALLGASSVTAQAPELGSGPAVQDTRAELSARTVDREYVEEVLRDGGVKMSADEFEKFYTECAALAIEAGEPIVLIDAAASVYNVVRNGTPKVTHWVIYPDGIVGFEFEGDNVGPEDRREEHIVDLTDPANMYKALMESPANPDNRVPPKTVQEQLEYECDLVAFRKNLIDTMREMGVDVTTGMCEELAVKFGDEESLRAWPRFFRDEAMTEEIASVTDIAVGDTVYYKIECAKGYRCTYFDINCPVIDGKAIYADIPGSEIRISLTTALVGDIDKSGSVDAKDITDYMKRLMAPTWMCWAEDYWPTDLNGDRVCDAKDITALMKHILGKDELPNGHYSYSYRKYFRAYTISIQPEGSEEVYKAPLPAPLPTMELSEDKSYITDYGINWTNPHPYDGLQSNAYYGVSSRFWRGYTFVEMEMEIVEGDTLPLLRIEDATAPYSGVPLPLQIHYSIPEGAKTVKATVRFAYLTDPRAQDRVEDDDYYALDDIDN